VRWWGENVSIRESPGRGGIESNAVLGSISKDDAEAKSGISKQQVSARGKRLKDPAALLSGDRINPGHPRNRRVRASLSERLFQIRSMPRFCITASPWASVLLGLARQVADVPPSWPGSLT
jgi:hypothetical protein